MTQISFELCVLDGTAITGYSLGVVEWPTVPRVGETVCRYVVRDERGRIVGPGSPDMRSVERFKVTDVMWSTKGTAVVSLQWIYAGDR